MPPRREAVIKKGDRRSHRCLSADAPSMWGVQPIEEGVWWLQAYRSQWDYGLHTRVHRKVPATQDGHKPHV